MAGAANGQVPLTQSSRGFRRRRRAGPVRAPAARLPGARGLLGPATGARPLHVPAAGGAAALPTPLLPARAPAALPQAAGRAGRADGGRQQRRSTAPRLAFLPAHAPTGSSPRPSSGQVLLLREVSTTLLLFRNRSRTAHLDTHPVHRTLRARPPLPCRRSSHTPTPPARNS